MSEKMTEAVLKQVDAFKPGSILNGKVVAINKDYVLVDIGYKAEGAIPRSQFKDFEGLELNQEVPVVLEKLEVDETGYVPLSKEKADLILNWNRLETAFREGSIIKGKVLSTTKGGYRVDIGVLAFLPASQADLHPPANPRALVGQVLDFKIIKLDRLKNNVVISRRQILEEEERLRRKAALEQLTVGQRVKGRVRNITDYGAFVDIGDITGLVHLNDLAWSRVTHPSQVLAVGDEVEVKILKINHEKSEVALGIKQTTPNPWEGIEKRYPVGSRVEGRVVNLTPYGGFIQLEDGVEGLLHISEISWTTKIKNPAEVLTMGDKVAVQIIGLEPEKEKISFSMKALEPNPWDKVPEKYPVGTVVKGKVSSLTNYGVFVELEGGVEGLLHAQELGIDKNSRPAEFFKKGERVEVVVLEVDTERQRIRLGPHQPFSSAKEEEKTTRKEEEG